MPTIKQRINITADPELESVIKKLAKRDNMPVSAKASELIRVALELEEDLVLSEIADSRSKKGPYIAHDIFWRSV